MSGNQIFKQAYPDFAPDYTFPNDQMRAAIAVARALASDTIGMLATRGGFWSAIGVTPRSPADLYIEVAALEGLSTLGEHLRKATASTVNCAVDYLGASCVPSSGNLWIGVFAKYAETESGSHSYDGDVHYDTATEGVTIQVRKGTATTPPVNPGSGMARVCNILMTEGITQITATNIKTAWPTHQDRLGFPVLDTGGTMTGLIYGPQGGVVPQMAYGGGLISYPVSLVPTGAAAYSEYFTTQMAGMYHTRFLINHGFQTPDVMLNVMLNYPTTARPKNYLTIYTNYVDAETVLGASTLMTHCLHLHDGAEHYTGQSLFIAVGSQAVVANYAANRWLRWQAIAPMYRADAVA